MVILCLGHSRSEAKVAAQPLNATLVDMHWIKPIDMEKILEPAKRHQLLFAPIENAVASGADAAVNELLPIGDMLVSQLPRELPDTFLEHLSQRIQYAWHRLDRNSICSAVDLTLKAFCKQADKQNVIIPLCR